MKTSIDISPKISPFEEAIERFVESIDSLIFSYSPIQDLLTSKLKELHKKRGDFLKKHGKVLKKTENMTTYELPINKTKEAKKLKNNFTIAEKTLKTSPETFLVTLVANYDAFLSQLLRIHYLFHPEEIENSKKTITQKEVFSFRNLDDIKDFLIKREVSDVLMKSHARQLSFIEEKLNIKTSEAVPSPEKFIELTQRRHLFVHNGGIISDLYLSNCSEAGVNISGLKSGDMITVTSSYLLDAFNFFYDIGVKIGVLFWEKQLGQNIDDAASYLLGIAYNLIDNKKYEMAIDVLSFLLNDSNKNCDSGIKSYLILNLAQAHKWKGDEKSCLEVLNRNSLLEDDPIIKIANFCLRNDFEKAAGCIPLLLNNKHFPANYNDWPIFQEFIKTPEFLKSCKSTYGSEFMKTISKDTMES